MFLAADGLIRKQIQHEYRVTPGKCNGELNLNHRTSQGRINTLSSNQPTEQTTTLPAAGSQQKSLGSLSVGSRTWSSFVKKGTSLTQAGKGCFEEPGQGM